MRSFTEALAALESAQPIPVGELTSLTEGQSARRLACQLEALGILSQLDRAALAGYCQAYGRSVEAERKLKETPILLRTPAGYVQPSPWLAIANKQLELIHRFMGELGLSPASRSRVTAFPSLAPKPWEGYDWQDGGHDTSDARDGEVVGTPAPARWRS